MRIMDNKSSPVISIVRTKSFELLLGILTLSSVVLALISSVPKIELTSDQMNFIYVFDIVVVAFLAFDFIVRTKYSKNKARYIGSHIYEIPAMIPLILFAIFEDPLLLGATLRSIRFIRLFRLMRLFRLGNLFRTGQYWRFSTFLYLTIILVASVTFGAIAILHVDDNNKSIQTLEDALWFSVTTLTISGFGDVRPMSPGGRIIAIILSIIGLGIILGFISNVGAGLINSRLSKTQKLFHEEKELIRNKINNLEHLHEDDISELVSNITTLHQKTKRIDNSTKKLCSLCNNDCTPDSVFCNKCGGKLA